MLLNCTKGMSLRTEAEDDGEEPADDVGEEHGHGDGPGGFDLGLDDFFGDVRGGVVVGHGPGD